MPGFFDNPTPTTPQKSGGFFSSPTPEPAAASGSGFFDQPDSAVESDTGFDLGAAALGVAGIAGAGYYAYKHPSSIPGKILSYANAARQQLMLSGLAVPKSMLGNVGAVVARSAEEGSFTPLKKFFSMETVDDAVDAYKNHGFVGPTAGVDLPGPMPGRIMGAMDQATQKALVRGGASADEAEAALFQTPLNKNYGKLGDALDSPTAKYIFPFRRTPYNQFFEGLQTLKPGYAHSGVRNAYMAAGAVHGAATSDEQYPMTLPLAAAASAKYGAPYAGAALVGRMLASGKGGGGITGTILPTSEYGTEQSLTNPLEPFVNPSGVKVLSKFFGSK